MLCHKTEGSYFVAKICHKSKKYVIVNDYRVPLVKENILYSRILRIIKSIKTKPLTFKNQTDRLAGWLVKGQALLIVYSVTIITLTRPCISVVSTLDFKARDSSNESRAVRVMIFQMNVDFVHRVADKGS